MNRKNNIVSFAQFKAAKAKPISYLGVIPRDDAEALRNRLIKLHEDHAAITRQIDQWQTDQIKVHQCLVDCLLRFNLAVYDMPFSVQNIVIDEHGHLFWRDEEVED